MTSKARKTAPDAALRAAREQSGFMSAAKAAKHFGWTISTYTSHENGTRPITLSAAKKYGAAFGIEENVLLGLGPPDVNDVQIVGAVGLGVWREVHVDAERKANKAAIGVPRSEGSSVRYSVHVTDDSVNKKIAAGSYAVCLPCDEDASPVIGQFYHIERVRGGMAERTIRRAEKTSDGRIVLRTHSSVASLASSVEMSNRGDEEVSLIGRVIGSYTPFTDQDS